MARIKYYDDETNSWKYADEMLTYPVATTTANGLMAASDKVALSSLTNRNLLDNSWFTINQRGATSVNSGYGVDRWKNGSSGTYTISNNIITISVGGYIIQPLEQDRIDALIGKTMTASLMMSDGNIYSLSKEVLENEANYYLFDGIDITTGISICVDTRQINNRITVVNRTNSTISIKAVKLEFGSVSTLANDTEPNYPEELLKCQRYYYRLSMGNASGVNIGVALETNTSNARLLLPTPAEMRGDNAPTIGYGNLALRDSDGGLHTIASISSVQNQKGSGVVLIISASNLTALKQYNLYNSVAGNTSYIEVSQDL